MHWMVSVESGPSWWKIQCVIFIITKFKSVYVIYHVEVTYFLMPGVKKKWRLEPARWFSLIRKTNDSRYKCNCDSTAFLKFLSLVFISVKIQRKSSHIRVFSFLFDRFLSFFFCYLFNDFNRPINIWKRVIFKLRIVFRERFNDDWQRIKMKKIMVWWCSFHFSNDDATIQLYDVKVYPVSRGV